MRMTAGAVLAGIALALAGVTLVFVRAASAQSGAASWPVDLERGTAWVRSAAPPPAPTGLTTNCAPSAGAVTLRWDRVPGADSYEVVLTSTSAGTVASTTSTRDTSLTVTVAAGGTYLFTVRGRVGTGWLGATAGPVGITLSPTLVCG